MTFSLDATAGAGAEPARRPPWSQSCLRWRPLRALRRSAASLRSSSWRCRATANMVSGSVTNIVLPFHSNL